MSTITQKQPLMNEMEYLRSRPQKRMGTGALFLDESDCILILKTTYRDHWEIPGGVVELNESPRAAVVREVREELNLTLCVEKLKLLCVDYLHPDNQRTEALMFVFYGGVIDAAGKELIQVDANELSGFRFADIDDAEKALGGILGPRIRRCFDGLKENQFVYFEDKRND